MDRQGQIRADGGANVATGHDARPQTVAAKKIDDRVGCKPGRKKFHARVAGLAQADNVIRLARLCMRQRQNVRAFGRRWRREVSTLGLQVRFRHRQSPCCSKKGVAPGATGLFDHSQV